MFLIKGGTDMFKLFKKPAEKKQEKAGKDDFFLDNDFVTNFIHLPDEEINRFFTENDRGLILYILKNLLRFYCYAVRNYFRGNCTAGKNGYCKPKTLRINRKEYVDFLSFTDAFHNIPECIFDFDKISESRYLKTEIVTSLYEIVSYVKKNADRNSEFSRFIMTFNNKMDPVEKLFDCYR